MSRLPAYEKWRRVDDAFARSDLSFPAKVLYQRLVSYADAAGECSPRRSRLAADLGVSERWVTAGLKELRAVRLIYSWKTRSGWCHCVRPLEWSDSSP